MNDSAKSSGERNAGNTDNDALPSSNNTDNANSAKKQMSDYTYWCFTLNNYDEKDGDLLCSIFDHECDWYVFQEEIGECGTPHFQGTLKLKKKMRLSALKKFNTRINWKPTHKIDKAIAYCCKEKTRNGKQWVKGIVIPKPVKVYEPRGWQLKVMEILAEEPDERTIYWFCEPDGKVGKTQLLKYLCVNHGAILIGGKSADAFFNIKKSIDAGTYKELVVCNIPRSSLDFINYGALECIKDGLVFSGKYESGQLVFNCPHLLVFANEKPDIKQMSADRWQIFDIRDLMKDYGDVTDNN